VVGGRADGTWPLPRITNLLRHLQPVFRYGSDPGRTTTLSCQGNEIGPNPFDVNLLVTNTGGEACHDVMATITPAPA